MALTIPLVPVPADQVRGIYNGGLPTRMRWLAPDAAASFATIAAQLVLSDMYRSAESSLEAMRVKRGVQPPGFSRHGFGRAIDLDIDETLKSGGFANKAALDGWMHDRAWLCHRLDHELGSEAWHYNFMPQGVIEPGDRSTAPAGERELTKLFGPDLAPDDEACQQLLAQLGMYHGAIDGLIGPQSRQAIGALQRAWLDGNQLLVARQEAESVQLGPITRRTLAFVAAGAPVAA